MDDGECAVKCGKSNEKILQFLFSELLTKIDQPTSPMPFRAADQRQPTSPMVKSATNQRHRWNRPHSADWVPQTSLNLTMNISSLEIES